MTDFSSFCFSALSTKDNRNMTDMNRETNKQEVTSLRLLSPTVAFILVSFSLGDLGDALNVFQGVYLVGVGWSEGSVGVALSLMGVTALIMQTFAGDLIDKTTIDRRIFLIAASLVTALSASMIFFVHDHSNRDHGLMFVSKIIDGISSSFIGPCLTALTLATFEPDHFDTVVASNILWGHIGSVFAAGMAGVVAYEMYPSTKCCFLVLSAAALGAVYFVLYLPEGDPQMGRGFVGKVAMNEFGHVETLLNENTNNHHDHQYDHHHYQNDPEGGGGAEKMSPKETPTAVTYWEVIAEKRSLLICLTGFLFNFADANVLLVLGELMGGKKDDFADGPSRTAIPLIAGAIVLSQATMSMATLVGKRMTNTGVGRKPLFMAGLISLPIRCALIILWKDAGPKYLLSTQILDGLGGGFFGLIHPYLVADITFGTGRFNLLMGLTASMFGLGATLSNFLGQNVAEHFGHMASLSGSLVISIIPIIIFGLFMPETLGDRGAAVQDDDWKEDAVDGEEEGIGYVEMT